MIETALRRRSSWLLAGVAAGALAAGPQAAAQVLPTGGTVVAQTLDGQGASISSEGPSLTVDQSSSRVVIDWASFNIGQGGVVTFNQPSTSSIAFNRIPTTAGVTSIQGALNANGSVWLFAPGGLLFGPSARVNVGSFFGGTSALADPATSGALTSNSVSGVANPDRSATLTVEAGAQLGANAGPLVLQSETITQNGAVSATGGRVVHTLHPSGGINWTGPGRIDSPDAAAISVVGSLAGRPLMNHGGSSTGVAVTVAAPRVIEAGYRGVINIGGTVVATGLAQQPGRGRVQIFGGPTGFNAAQGAGGTMAIDTSAATISATAGVQAAADEVVLGAVSSGPDATLRGLQVIGGSGGVILAGPATTTGAATITTRNAAGDIVINADLRAQDYVDVSARNLTIARGSTVQADADGLQNGEAADFLSLAATRTISAAGTTILSGASAGAPRGELRVSAGRGQAAADPGGDLTLGAVQGGTVTLSARSGSGATGELTVGGPVVGLQSVSVETTSATELGRGGALRLQGDVSSNGGVLISNTNAGDIEVSANVNIRSDVDADAEGALILSAQGDVLAQASSLLAGGSAGRPTADVEVTSGATTPGGGDLVLGAVAGRNVRLQAYGDGAAVQGDVVLNGAVTSRGLYVASGEYARPNSGGDVRINASLTAVDELKLINFGDGDLVVAPGVTIRADSDGSGPGEAEVGLEADFDGDILAGAGSTFAVGSAGGAPTGYIDMLVRGRYISEETYTGQAAVEVANASALTVTIESRSGTTGPGSISVTGALNGPGQVRLLSPGGTFRVASSGSVTGGSAQQPASGVPWPSSGVTAEQAPVRIEASDFDLQGTVAARSSAGAGDIILDVGERGGTIGDAASGTGFALSNAEMQQFTARRLVLGAGGDLTIGSLTLNGDRVGSLYAGAPAANTINVTGNVTGAGSVRPDLRLGFILGESSGSGGQPRPLPSGEAFVPRDIVVTGALGAPDALGQVSLLARQDVLVGTPEFVGATRAPGFDPTRPPTITPSAPDAVLIRADGLQLGAGARALQQNTGSGRNFAGLLVGTPTDGRPLLIGFSDLGSSSDGGRVVSLFGSFNGADGQPVVGRDAARLDFLTGEGLTLSIDSRFNSCAFGPNGACTGGGGGGDGGGTQIPVFTDPTINLIDESLGLIDLLLDPEANDTVFVVPQSLVDEQEERDAIGLPITGSGNEDLWSGQAREIQP